MKEKHTVNIQIPNIDCADGMEVKQILIFRSTKTRNWFFNNKIYEDPVKLKSAIKRGGITVCEYPLQS
jgi:hypothetical protein